MLSMLRGFHASLTGPASHNLCTNTAGTKGAGAGLAVEQLVALAAVPAAKAAHLGEEWLSEANKELFERWESGLEDYSKDLMEAFAW